MNDSVQIRLRLDVEMVEVLKRLYPGLSLTTIINNLIAQEVTNDTRRSPRKNS